MLRPLNLFQQRADVVVRTTWHRTTKVAYLQLKRHFRPRLCALRERAAQVIVDDRLEGSPGAARFRLQAGRDVVLQRQSGSHILMLPIKHQDVQKAAEPQASRGAAALSLGRRRCANGSVPPA